MRDRGGGCVNVLITKCSYSRACVCAPEGAERGRELHRRVSVSVRQPRRTNPARNAVTGDGDHSANRRHRRPDRRHVLDNAIDDQIDDMF
jgi:hypothetical protein